MYLFLLNVSTHNYGKEEMYIAYSSRILGCLDLTAVYGKRFSDYLFFFNLTLNIHNFVIITK